MRTGFSAVGRRHWISLPEKKADVRISWEERNGMDALFGDTSSAGKRTFLAKQRTEYLWARLISSNLQGVRGGELFKVAEGGEVC